MPVGAGSTTKPALQHMIQLVLIMKLTKKSKHHIIRADEHRSKREKAEKKKEIELGIIDQERGKFMELAISNTMVSHASRL